MTALLDAPTQVRGLGAGTKPDQHQTGFGSVDRVSIRAMVRRLVSESDGCRSVARCGLPFGASRLRASGGRLVPGQVQVCGSGLRCVWCAGWQGRSIVERGGWFAGLHAASGGWFVHSALTVPHRRSDSLRVVLGRLRAVWGGLRHLRVFRRWRALAGVTPLVVLQVGWSVRSGWHPHFHVLWFGLSGDPVGDPVGFAGDVDVGWSARVRSVTDRGSRFSGRSEWLLEAEPWLEYVVGEDDRFELDPCLAPSHGGCGRCDTGGVGGWLPPVGFGGESLSAGSRLLPVWGGLGVAGVAGDRLGQALVAEFVESTVGERRVLSWSELGSRFGSPPRFERAPVEGAGGVWLSAGLVAGVELAGHKRRWSPLRDGLLRVDAGDLVGAAGLWSGVCGRLVVVGVASDDGAPLFRFSDEELVDLGGRVMSDVLLGAGVNGTEKVVEAPVVGGRLRVALTAMLSKLGDESALGKLVEDASKNKGRSKDQAWWFHEQIVGSGDEGLRSGWADLLAGFFESHPELDGVAFQWLAELEGWS